VTEPPWLWERAKDYLTKDELTRSRGSFSYALKADGVIANGLGMRTRPRFFTVPRGRSTCSRCGPASVMTSSAHCMCVMCTRRNAITKEQADYSITKGSYLPEPRLRDMDIQGSTKC